MKTFKLIKLAIIFTYLLMPYRSVSQCFSQIPSTSAVAGPKHTISGDFNGDGKIDIVTANESSNNTTVLFGNGLGSFTAFNSYKVGGSPSALISKDLNGDGKMDIITSNTNTSTISVLLGNGNGTFQSFNDFATGGSYPNDLVSGDFDGDGKIDIITANETSNNISLLHGNGTGGFSFVNTFSVATQPMSIKCSDFNSDGKLDIVTLSKYTTNNISLLIGNGTGGFSSATNFAVSSNAYSFANIDFNNDSKMDLILAGSQSTGITIMLGNGLGGFSSSDFSFGKTPIGINSADFNGDGKLDIVTSNGSNDMTVLIANGNGGVSNYTNYVIDITRPTSLLCADFNNDSKIDIAGSISLSYSNSIFSIFNNGNGTFQTIIKSNFGSAGGPEFIINVDVNGDGNKDLITTNSAADNISVTLGNGKGDFTTENNFAVRKFPRGITAADFDKDGNIDLAVANFNSDNISILFGDGKGKFPFTDTIMDITKPYSITSADFNGDGKMDIATCNYGSNNVGVSLGNGFGGFSTFSYIAVGTNPVFIDNADYNGDGKVDLAILNSNSKNVSVLFGNGLGGFSSAYNLTFTTDQRALTSGDLNNDGRADLAVASISNNKVTVFLANTTGSFSTPSSFNISSGGGTSIVKGDFNGDGNVDLGCGINPNFIAIYNGDGNGNFSSPTIYSVALNAQLITVGDFNADGKLDLVNAYSSSLIKSGLLNKSILLNISSLNVSPCNGGNNGTATVSATGGISTYNYLWSTTPPQTSQTASGLSAGTYIVTVSDTSGCSASKNIIITQPPAMSINFNKTNVSCNGGNTGKATVNVIANGKAPYTYQWNTSPPQTTQTAVGLVVGTYTVIVKDSIGCTVSQNVSISQPLQLSATFIPSIVSNCSSPCSASVILNVTGGQPPYTYLWDISSGSQTTSTATNLCAGSYFVTITDSNGCKLTKAITIIPISKVNPEVYVSNIAAVDKVNADPSFTAYYNYDLPSNITSNSTNPKNYVDPGKFVRFKIQSANHKSNGLSMVNGHSIIRSSDPNITITDSLSNLNNIAYNDSAWSTDEFEIFIKPTTPNGANIYVDFIVEENGIQWATTCVAIPVHPLVYSPPNINTVNDDNNGDSHGNNDGICDKGETIEFYPFLNSITNLNASYVRGRLSNLDNLSYVNIWNNHTGVSGTVYNASWWNFAFGVPAQIPAGQKNMSPEFDFVFDYTNPNVALNFKLYHVLSGGFKLFQGNALSLVQWTIPYTFIGTGGVGINPANPNGKELTITPNPNNGIFSITTNIKGSFFEIINVLGESIFFSEINSPQTVIDLSKQPKGIYVYRLKNEVGIIGTGKIILN